jgi:hypothetical protein
MKNKTEDSLTKFMRVDYQVKFKFKKNSKLFHGKKYLRTFFL